MNETPKTERPPEDPEVLDLVNRAQAGDFAAYETLMQCCYGKVYGLVYGMTCHREDAEELVQETFVRGWKTLGNFSGQSRFCVWIYRIALNRALHFCKRRRRQTGSLDEFDPGFKTSELYRELSGKGAVLRKISLREFQEKMNKALLRLSVKRRAVVVMHDVQGISFPDVAEALLCSEGTVNFRLFYAYRQLRADLAEFDQTGQREKEKTPEQNIAGLLALKAYERPDAARVKKTIQSTMRIVRETSNIPSLLLLPDKGSSWFFTQPRYGIAALFLIFLGMHLLKNPVPAAKIGSVDEIRQSGEEMDVSINTNKQKTVAIPGIAPPFSVTEEPPVPPCLK